MKSIPVPSIGDAYTYYYTEKNVFVPLKILSIGGKTEKTIVFFSKHVSRVLSLFGGTIR